MRRIPLRTHALLTCAFGACLAAAAAAGAYAQQNYPVKSIRLVVPLAPGGPSDILARTMGQKLTESMKQTVVVDNRTGAAGIIGTDIAAKSPADGYTLLLIAAATYKFQRWTHARVCLITYHLSPQNSARQVESGCGISSGE